MNPAADTFDFEPTLEWCREKRATKWWRPGPDVLPAWVADMDFALCPPVADAITGLIDRGDLCYPDWDRTPLAEPFAERMSRLYGWEPDPGHVRHVSDLIQAFQLVTEFASEPGDAVVAHVPNYPPFLASLAEMARTRVGIAMEPSGEQWAFDPQRLDDDVAASRARILLVVNPHNPTGRVLTRAELETLADVACRHDLTIVSDEIHAELAYEGVHIPIASLSDEVANRTVTITSASKTFNLAALRTGVAHVGSPAVRARWDALPRHLLGAPNVVGVEATRRPAWSAGDPWLAALRRHLTAQRAHLGSRIGELPGVTWRPPQATYLAWLDCRQAAMDGEDPAAFFRSKALVEVNRGLDYGPGGAGHARLNFATGRAILDEILDRMRDSLSTG